MKDFGIGALGLTAVAVAALLTASAACASADELSPAAAARTTQVAQAPMAMPMYYNWTGFYVGVNGGLAAADIPASSFYALTPPLNGNDFSPTGFAGGVQAGFNWQWNWLVLGLEADFQGDTASQTSTAVDGVGGVLKTKVSQNWFGTVRPRIGVAAGNGGDFLLYATGGFAYMNVTDTDTATTAGVTRSTGGTSTKSGWVAGLGAETPVNFIFGLPLVAGLEYMHLDVGNASAAAPAAGVFAADTTSFKNKADVFRVRLSYRFGAPQMPPPMQPVAAPAQAPMATPAPQRQMFLVFFDFDKSTLTPDGRKVVDAAAAAVKSGRSNVAVAGYTDLSGTAAYNMRLSERRADAVKAALVRDGVPAGEIAESWHGKENPRVPTADGVREPQNRRVEVTM